MKSITLSLRTNVEEYKCKYIVLSHKELQMKTIQWQSKKFMSMVTALFVVLFVIMLKGCGGGDGSSSISDIFVEAPGAPQNFAISDSIGQGMVTLTLTWDKPITGGTPTTYEIYRTTTAPTAENPVFQPDNHLISLSATTFEFIENAAMDANVATYWVVAAKNAGGETPSVVVAYTPPGSTEGYGNNFASALIFADGYGITGLLLDTNKSWTENNLSAIDFNTGLRPTSTEALTLAAFPYFDESTTHVLDGVTYYKQKTVSTWQGEWKNGASTDHNVTAKWGDNLISQSLTANSVIRVEMVLTEALSTPMKSYKMVSLYGTKVNEIYGTDKTTYENNTSFVFASNAHLTIQKVDDNGTLEAPLYDQDLWEGDGPGYFAAEVNVAGNFTYGFVWNLKNNITTYPKTGKWRITFSLNPVNLSNIGNNTFIKTVANGVLDSNTSVHIDINIGQ